MKSKWLVASILSAVMLIVLLIWSVSPDTNALAQEPQPGTGLGPEDSLAITGIVSETISYQGLLEEGGNPVNGNRDMTFRLYSDAACTTQVGSDIVKSGVAVQNGLFSVQLDVSQSDFDGKGLWLEVEVDGTKIGCQAILATPYALSLRPGAVISSTFLSSGALLSANAQSGGLAVRGALAQELIFTAAGLYGRADMAGVGVYGLHSPDSGAGWGVYGASNSPDGFGVYGANFASSGTAAGVQGTTYSPQAYAVGVLGEVNSTSPGGFSAAVRGNNNGQGGNGIGVYGYQDGTGWGVYGRTGGTGYAGYFDGNVLISGTCTGCALAYIALNDSNQPLEAGDLVAVSGVAGPLKGANVPLLRVQPVSGKNANALIGVVGSRAQHVSTQSDGQREIDNVVRADGPAAPGDYLFIIVSGMTQVKVDAAAGPIQPGDSLTVAASTTGYASLQQADAAASPSVYIGQALEAVPTGKGLIWVMLDISK